MGIGIIHNPVEWSRVPVNSCSLLYVIVTCSLSNAASHPTSHNCPMDKSELELSSGKRCMMRAVCGREGMFIDVCAVEEI